MRGKKPKKLQFFWDISHLMTKNLDNEGLRSIVENYDFFFIDLWGVVHNGIKLHENAIEALNELDAVRSVGTVLRVIGID